MTDNEIIKAFMCCSNSEGITDCECCPYHKNGCLDKVHNGAIDLIIRQKAEIERLESNLKFVRGTVERMRKYDEERDVRLHAKLTETAKAEAIKEFAERLKGQKTKPEFPWDDFFVTETDIDNLVKEMVGEGK